MNDQPCYPAPAGASDAAQYKAAGALSLAPGAVALALANHRALAADAHAPKQPASAAGLPPLALARAFTTLLAGRAVEQAAPTVNTASVGTITGTSAVLGGNATADGSVRERGVVYSASVAVPTIGDGTKVQIGQGSGTFAQSVSLASNTTYYVRAYAISAAGIFYGNALSFKTLASLSAAIAMQSAEGKNGGNDSALVLVAGGSAPYAYSWRNTTTGTTLGQTGARVAGLAPGCYTVTVTDSTGATTTASATISLWWW